MGRIGDALEAASRWLAASTKVVCVLVLFVMLGLLATQVVARYVFDAPPSWTEELAISLFAWLVLLYASVGVREGFHVAVDLLSRATPRAIRMVSDRIVLALTFVLGIALVLSGWRYTVDTAGQMSAALQYPIEALHAAAPAGGALIALHALARFVRPAPDGDR